jgi:hypothetical protein
MNVVLIIIIILVFLFYLCKSQEDKQEDFYFPYMYHPYSMYYPYRRYYRYPWRGRRWRWWA